MTKIILLGHSGFWMESRNESAPPTYHVPYLTPQRLFVPDQDGLWPSYGTMIFDCIARSHDGSTAVYMQRS